MFGYLPPGITMHDVMWWVDGIGLACKKTKEAFTSAGDLPTIGDKKFHGRILTFNGTSSSFDSDALTGAKVGTGDITLTAWINPASFGTSGVARIVSNTRIIFRINTTNDLLNVSYDGSTFAASATNSIVTSAWTFVAATMSSGGGSTGNLYVNGVLSGTADQAVGTASEGPVGLYCGQSGTGIAFFDGDIAQILLIRKVLTVNQISWMYNKFK